MKKFRRILYLLMITSLFIPVVLFADDDDPVSSDDNENKTPVVVEESTPKLSNLGASGYNFTQSFNPDRFDYELHVPSTTTTIDLIAQGDNFSGRIDGLGTKNIVNSTHKFTVVVYSKPNGEKKTTYNIVVKKQASNLVLKSLIVNGFDLEEEFDPKKTTYRLEVPFDVENLDVVARQEDISMSLEITGNEDLIIGTNKIFIKIYNKETKEENIYTIIVNRLRDEDEEIEEEIVPEEEKSNTFKIVIITIAIILLLILSGLGVYFYLKTKKDKPKKEEKNNKTISNEDEVITDIKELEEVEEVVEITNMKTKEIVINRPDLIDELDSLFDDTK